LRRRGEYVLDLLQEPPYADKHLVLFTHARLMLAVRMAIGGHAYVALRERGLPNGIHGIMIGNCQMETYERTARPATEELADWFTRMRVRQTWGETLLDSGYITIQQRD
jgi:hypothetical protein